MESHIPEYLKKAWPSMKEFHKKYNIELDEKFVESILNSDKSFVSIAYGDTDSCAKDTIIKIENNGVIESLTIEDLYNMSKRELYERIDARMRSLKEEERKRKIMERRNRHKNAGPRF